MSSSKIFAVSAVSRKSMCMYVRRRFDAMVRIIAKNIKLTKAYIAVREEGPKTQKSKIKNPKIERECHSITAQHQPEPEERTKEGTE